MKERNLIFITILLGAIFQLGYLFSHGILSLLINTIPDDSFYYFQVARNIVEGYGSTFDKVNLGNGYHPLWMLLLLPIFKIFSVGGVSDTAPIYASLTFAVLLSFLTSIVLYLVLTRFTQNAKIISFVLFVYLFNPVLLYNILNGLETSLVLLLLVAYVLGLIKVQESLSTVNLVVVGIVGGLLSLARLDMALVVAFGNIFILYNFGRYNVKKAINYFLVSSITAALIYISWAIYNFKMFGMYLTSASITSTFINHRLTYGDNGGYSVALFVKTIVYMLERAVQQIVGDLGAPIIMLGFLGIGMYFFFKHFTYQKLVNYKEWNLSPVFFVTIGLLALVFVSAGLRWTFRVWYFIPLFIPSSIFLTWVMQRLWLDFQLDFKSRFVQNSFLGILIFGISFSYFVTWTKDLKDNQILQKQMYEAALWQNENLPEGSHIGVFNAGMQAYFSNHKVTNLDGLINNNASKAMLNDTLWNYMTQVEHLDYVSDFDSYMTYRYKDSFGVPTGEMYSHFEKVMTISGPKDLNVYKVMY